MCSVRWKSQNVLQMPVLFLFGSASASSPHLMDATQLAMIAEKGHQKFLGHFEDHRN